MIYKAPRGTSDILELDIQLWHRIYEKSREIFNLFGFKEIVTPIFEDSRLFSRSLGQTSDIVTKQMLNIQTKDRPLTLRPEGTASIIRAYLEHNLDKKEAFKKIFYIGPMFRGERPQKGRLRQFNHIGAEAIGSRHPAVDAELIVLMTRLLNSFGVSDYEIILNSVGCQKDKEKLQHILKDKLKVSSSALCDDCRQRLSRNVLRVLDCKNQKCREIAADSMQGEDFRCPDCSRHFENVKKFLSKLEVKFQEAPFLVRGLDYYTGTVFEVIHSRLGSQDAVGAGGRYDNLVKQLGGPDTGAVGFALGVERIILALDDSGKTFKQTEKKSLDVFVALTKDDFFAQGLTLLTSLRDARICADIDYSQRSLKAQMRKANNFRARIVLILGEDEIASGRISIKDMETGRQETYPQREIVVKIRELLKK